MAKLNHNNSEEAICHFIFKSGNLDEKESENLLSLFILFIARNEHVPYDLISEYVYKLDDDDKLDSLYEEVHQKIYSAIPSNADDEKFKKGFDKLSSDILRHIRLSIIQKKYIVQESKKASEMAKSALQDSTKAKQNVDKAKDDINKVKNDIEMYSNDINRVKDDIEVYSDDIKDAKKAVSGYSKEMKSVKGNIYTDFISILGIFTAITFATFGGLQLLGNVFGQNATKDNHSLGSALILGSLYIFGTYLLLLALLSGIHKLMRMNNYNDEDNLTNKVQDNDYHYSKELMIIISIFCLMILAGGTILIMFF
ncbi:hypothetical protein ACOMA7_00520 [Apilactobacillus sp. 1-1-2]|uniref:hypothetical protein n=1 Tax=Apilactobacillus sp. 1-1-2 TaxID=3411035 RepID=UPI003B92D876